ncbi:uncharacterized protein LOC110459059 [Mizuhopecten yessoensis]|uniref:uncharacterized protein LOC110459059 n=1 Tax=Mizuhopecten yessoensis TaxID=6573 RepID=UPI000B45CA8C|nr:uncharacterized protein LOC110459059 [Mizuhopecten yessoensis]
MVECILRVNNMLGLTDRAAVVMSLSLQVAYAQHFNMANINFDSSTPMPELSSMVMFYISPVLTVVILLICIFCLNHLIRQCKTKMTTGRRTLPTISGSVQNGLYCEPPPPYTLTDISHGAFLPEESLTNCPAYTEDPPTYLELTVLQNNS